MRVLIVKTSSLGDVIHTLVAVTDAVRHIPGIRCDWLVEEAFAEIPAWHSAVEHIITIALRRWRRQPLASLRAGAWRQLRERLRQQRYDAVIDAQGLLKSAWLARMARGPRYGLAWASAREPLASLAYDHRVTVAKDRHAIDRLRRLFAVSLGYREPVAAIDYGIVRERLPTPQPGPPYLVFLHGASWASKRWPEPFWIVLAEQAHRAGFQAWLPHNDESELRRAERIAIKSPNVKILRQMNLTDMAGILAGAAGIVGADSGLAHLGAALGVPGVTLYGATTPALTGARGPYQRNLAATFACAPCLRRHCHYLGASAVQPACYATLPPERALATLQSLIHDAQAAYGIAYPSSC